MQASASAVSIPPPPSSPDARRSAAAWTAHTARSESNSGTPTASSASTPSPAMNDAFDLVEIDNAARTNREQAAGIAQEYAGRIEIAAKESEAGARQTKAAASPGDPRNTSDRPMQWRDQRNAGGQAVTPSIRLKAFINTTNQQIVATASAQPGSKPEDVLDPDTRFVRRGSEDHLASQLDQRLEIESVIHQSATRTPVLKGENRNHQSMDSCPKTGSRQ